MFISVKYSEGTLGDFIFWFNQMDQPNGLSKRLNQTDKFGLNYCLVKPFGSTICSFSSVSHGTRTKFGPRGRRFNSPAAMAAFTPLPKNIAIGYRYYSRSIDHI